MWTKFQKRKRRSLLISVLKLFCGRALTSIFFCFILPPTRVLNIWVLRPSLSLWALVQHLKGNDVCSRWRCIRITTKKGGQMILRSNGLKGGRKRLKSLGWLAFDITPHQGEMDEKKTLSTFIIFFLSFFLKNKDKLAAGPYFFLVLFTIIGLSSWMCVFNFYVAHLVRFHAHYRYLII